MKRHLRIHRLLRPLGLERDRRLEHVPLRQVELEPIRRRRREQVALLRDGLGEEFGHAVELRPDAVEALGDGDGVVWIIPPESAVFRFLVLGGNMDGLVKIMFVITKKEEEKKKKNLFALDPSLSSRTIAQKLKKTGHSGKTRHTEDGILAVVGVGPLGGLELIELEDVVDECLLGGGGGAGRVGALGRGGGHLVCRLCGWDGFGDVCMCMYI